MKVGVYRTDEDDVNDAMVDSAINSLNNLANQLSTDEPINVEKEEEVSGSWNNISTYDGYLNEFDNQVDFSIGETGVLIYYRQVIDGTPLSAEAVAGKASVVGGATQFNPEYCVVNGGMYSLDKVTYENFVKHEWLHLHGAEHSDGTQYNKIYGRANSPMITGYAEPIRGGNQIPDNPCDIDEVNTTLAHNEQISSCVDVSSTIDENF
ncbi:hypothetical protein EXE41_11030 [Halorubrum sp. SD690R]|uniref:hypothetical protein n=1 Tax=Halorubrum sp. SD690R TaxID=2518117 RepID=UPI0010F90BC9|nr:hypothetical protein [Halorubrum sp. SD690R]TKX45550.1 hypothetical protein EXE41_11030 [Halorubrum sp. SD690R]